MLNTSESTSHFADYCCQPEVQCWSVTSLEGLTTTTALLLQLLAVKVDAWTGFLSGCHYELFAH